MTDTINVEINNTDMDYSLFYDHYYPETLRYLCSKGISIEEAQDIAQNVFQYCWAHFSEYDKTKASLRTWLYIIINGRWKNYCRDNRKVENIDAYVDVLSDEENSVESAIELHQLRNALAEALEELAENERKIIVWHYFAYMKFDDIARRMSISPANARKISSRALKSLKRKLKEYVI